MKVRFSCDVEMEEGSLAEILQRCPFEILDPRLLEKPFQDECEVVVGDLIYLEFITFEKDMTPIKVLAEMAKAKYRPATALEMAMAYRQNAGEFTESSNVALGKVWLSRFKKRDRALCISVCSDSGSNAQLLDIERDRPFAPLCRFAVVRVYKMVSTSEEAE